MMRRTLTLTTAAVLGASALHAQAIRAADTTLRAGAIGAAESALYDAVRTRPRDPGARVALGRYLAARGATRVGMTLLEEAIKFGGDAAAIEPDLVRAYLDAGEYRSLASLASIPAAQRERAQWLVAHESRAVAPDSVTSLPFRKESDEAIVGRVALRVDGRTIEAAISPLVSGVVISDTSSVARQLHRFAQIAERGKALAAADSLGLGGLSISNVPVTIARVDGRHVAVIGLDWIGQYSPTFDPASGRVTLRIGAPGVPLPNGLRFSTWSKDSDLQVLLTGGWVSVTRPPVARALRDRRWTFDAKRGALVLEP